jgi:hypothetical protein
MIGRAGTVHDMKSKWPIRLACSAFLALLVIVGSECERSRGIAFWPAGAFKRHPKDWVVNSHRQKRALTVAKAERDAISAFRAGDARYLADAISLGRCLGLPDWLSNRVIDEGRFKVIGMSLELEQDDSFVTSKRIYEKKYNLTMVELTKDNLRPPSAKDLEPRTHVH